VFGFLFSAIYYQISGLQIVVTLRQSTNLF
jgi:hypothetical protein